MGTNWPAVIATGVGCFLSWIGLLVKPLRIFFDSAWFVGTLGAGLVYFLLMLPERAELRAARAAAPSKR
jgi:cytosine/uracil/thiamine/allantoin permease